MITNRRTLLAGTGALAAYWGLSAFQDAGAAPAQRRKTLVVVFLRGGADGLNLVVPWKEERYYRLRRGIAVPRPGEPDGALDLDGFFGLHPAAAPLEPLFRAGAAVAVHAVGSARNTRSHFEEQDAWETGLADSSPSSAGWLNRHLATSSGDGPIRAISVGGPLPRILRGEAKALAIRGLADLGASGGQAAAALERAYESAAGGMEGGADVAERAQPARSLLAADGRATLEALRVLEKVAGVEDAAPAPYPPGEFGRRMRDVARLIEADVGLEVAEVDLGGWDTHQDQGGIRGPYHGLVAQLAGGIAAFAADLEGRMDDVLVLTLSEFGRTAAENGTNGTDHGWGSCVLAVGGAVRAKGAGGARGVIGAWPGLEEEELHQRRDLALETDFRDVIAEVVRGHLGNERLAEVLPGREPREVGIV